SSAANSGNAICAVRLTRYRGSKYICSESRRSTHSCTKNHSRRGGSWDSGGVRIVPAGGGGSRRTRGSRAGGAVLSGAPGAGAGGGALDGSVMPGPQARFERNQVNTCGRKWEGQWDRGQRTEGRGQRTEDRGQRAEGRGQRAE